MKDWLLKAFRWIDFTAIFKTVISTLGLPFGWLISLIGGSIVSGVEKKVDQEIDSMITIDESDKQIDSEKLKHEQAIANAKTDEDLATAMRDSLRK